MATFWETSLAFFQKKEEAELEGIPLFSSDLIFAQTHRQKKFSNGQSAGLLEIREH